ncbi:exodeoxyribonuclease V subunit beta [Thalassolituus oleivorans]|uniref:exodeoxyribonuclease V subunit beta n=1 Tax=Thalassolituus oleivorans TaxID=187493 RepID=UPI0030C7A567
MKRLNIDQFPLQGQSLIEASAGTGKTYTITQLYKRLLLAHRSDLPRLGTDQILVVTFTRAATEELRGRIREGIRETFEHVLSRQQAPLNAGEEATHELDRWLAEVAHADSATLTSRELTKWLQLNLSQMDEAAIYTIHGFCQRMLKQFAFDSAVVFDAELVLDAGDYLKQACEDVWRSSSYPLGLDQSRFVCSQFSGPDKLFSLIRNWLSRPDFVFSPNIVKADTSFVLEQEWAKAEALYQRVAELWHSLGATDVADLIAQSGVDKRSYSKKHLPNWLEQANDYLTSGFSLPATANLYRFGQEELLEKTKKGEAPTHALFAAVDAFLPVANQLSLALQQSWYFAVKARYLELLERSGALTPDDLLRLLDQALAGPQGELLAAHIRAQYPVAMIDEFQDTDPLQYRIFSRIYPYQSADAKPGYGLYMIGDPKQAIYGFRGADIFTYIQARRSLPDERRFTLDTNYRSHSGLVAAVNQLWQAHAKPFIFDDDIKFLPVDASGRRDDGGLQLSPQNAASTVSTAQALPLLHLWQGGAGESRAAERARVAAECASQIQALLQGGGSFGESPDNKPVQASDIAVLVYSRKQAGRIRHELSRLGIGSVFLTRDSVYDSQEARDVFSWLQAIAQPSDERAVRSALSTQTYGLSADRLDHLLNDERAWEQQLSVMFKYHELWQKRGVMAAMMQWLEDDQRAVRLRSQDDGERCLTNLLHLGELLQQGSRRLRGHQALIRWFGDQVFATERSGEEAQLRLESDANLVNIVTIHKSKGLEYPLVFLPYLWEDSFIPFSQSEAHYVDDKQGLVINLAPDQKAKDAQIRDNTAENLRLLYVALTRARHACFIWVSTADSKKKDVPQLAFSALGYLLQCDVSGDIADFNSEVIYQGPMPVWLGSDDFNISNTNATITANHFNGYSRDLWRVSSYSQLTAASHAHAAPTGEYALILEQTDQPTFDVEAESLQLASLYSIDDSTIDIQQANIPAALSFPKGATPGTCLHAILEVWDFVDAAKLHELCLQQLQHFGLDIELEPALAQWLQQVVTCPLVSEFESEFSLAQLKRDERLDEMEFHLPIAQLSSAEVNRLLEERALQFDSLQGYLKGFIDLIFCRNGRYYVADYKSNHLGNSAENYQPESLWESMKDHNYDLQAWIYTVALDQLLRVRLPNYSPEQHLGGTYYLYLRGMITEFTGEVFDDIVMPDVDAKKQKTVNKSVNAMQGDLFAAEPSVPRSSASDGAEQAKANHAGVFYLPPDLTALAQWRKVLLGVDA